MRTVWIIGTRHDYQRLRLGVSDPGPEQFRIVLTAICSGKDVQAIGEEMSPEGLRINGAYDSVCRQVADALGIPHRYCVPSSGERRALGIIEGDAIRESRLWADCEEHDFEAEVRDSYDKRRRRWLEHLFELNAWPLLFVCGANHAKPFRQLLRATSVDAHVLFTNWSPD
jgi:hypothetical protein